MSHRKFSEIDARLAVVEANLMVQDTLLIHVIKWLAQTPDGADMRDSLAFQLDSEAARFASMEEDRAGRFSAISEALRGMATAIQSDPPEPDKGGSGPRLRLVKND